MAGSNLPAISLGLASAALWGAGDFNGGLGSKGSSAYGVVLVAHGMGLLCMLALAVLIHEPVPPFSILLWGAIAGTVGGIGLAALYRALAIGQMGINAPVAAVVTATLPVLVSIRTDGVPSILQVFGFGVAVIAIWLIAMPSGKLGRPRGVGLALVAGIGFSGFLVFIKQAAGSAVFWPLATARLSSMATMLLLAIGAGNNWRPNRKFIGYMILAGALDAFGNALFVLATRYGRLDQAAVLSSLYPASTIILARIFLKERISPLQTTGMAAALAAIPMIAAR